MCVKKNILGSRVLLIIKSMFLLPMAYKMKGGGEVSALLSQW